MAFALRSPAAIHELNVTPLIDVLLVLLLVFLLSAPPLLSEVPVQLPQDGRQTPVGERIVLSIGADGDLTWNGQSMPRAALLPQLALEATRDPQPILALAVAPQAAFEAPAQVLALAQAAGLRTVGFVED